MNAAQITPPRCSIVNVVTSERFDFQFNPTSLEEARQVAYSRAETSGLSHQRMFYKNTGNREIPVEIFMSQIAQDSDGLRGQASFEGKKRFLESLIYPVGDLGSPSFQGPPRILFVWPCVISIVGRVTNLKFMHRSFSPRTGATTMLVANMTIEEDRDTMLRMETVRRGGSSSATISSWTELD